MNKYREEAEKVLNKYLTCDYYNVWKRDKIVERIHERDCLKCSIEDKILDAMVEMTESKLEQAEKEKKELVELLNEAAHFLNHQGDLSAMPTDKWTYKEWLILRFQLNEKLKQIES